MIKIRRFFKESIINKQLADKYWVSRLYQFEPHDTEEGHWGKGQTGFNISESGKIYLSDNRKVKRVLVIGYDEEEEWDYPDHRDLITGSGKDNTIYSGIYSWVGREDPALWLYPDTEDILNEEMKEGLASLIGVHEITEDTPVYSNSSRELLFRLGDIV